MSFDYEHQPTGSTYITGVVGNDIDIVLPITAMPCSVQAELEAIGVRQRYENGDKYPDSFVNVKIDNYDFIIVKYYDTFLEWCYATNNLKYLYEKGNAEIGRNKEFRTKMFELLVAQYKELSVYLNKPNTIKEL